MTQSRFDATVASANGSLYDVYGVGATYTPNGGSAVSVTVLVDEDTRDSVDRSRSRNTEKRLIGTVRVSEVSTLSRGDTFQLSGESIVYRVLPTSCTNDGVEWDFEAVADETTAHGDIQVIPDR